MKWLAGWGLWVALVLTILGWHAVARPDFIGSDIFRLLPEGRSIPVLREARHAVRDEFFREVLVLVEAPDDERADAAASRAARALDGLHWLERIEPTSHAGPLLRFYEEHPFHFLAADDRASLSADPVAAFANAVRTRLAAPGRSSAYGLTEDPGGYLSRFVEDLPRAYADLRPQRNAFAGRRDDTEFRLLVARSQDAEFARERQQGLLATLDGARRAIERDCADCVLRWTGAVRFAAAARASAEADVRLISTVSLATLLVLFLAVFRSIRPFLYTLLPLLVGVASGVAACAVVFGELHVLTLVFGTTLLGLLVDYVFHILVHRWVHREGTASGNVGVLMPALALGLATSAIAFAFLLLAGFPALSRLGVFSVAGLFGGWLTAIAILPRLPGIGSQGRERLVALAAGLDRRLAAPRLRIVAVVAAMVIAAPGLAQLRVDDDIRDLRAVPDDLIDEDRFVRTFVGRTGGTNFFLVEGSDRDRRLQREEQLFADHGSDGLGLSRFLPSSRRQLDNLGAYRPLFERDGGRMPVESILADLGFRASVIADLVRAWESDRRAPSPARLVADLPSDSGLSRFEVRVSGQGAQVARIEGVAGEAARALARGLEGVRYVEPVRWLRDVFAGIRQHAVYALVAAYLLVGLGMTLRYGARGAVGVLLPSALGAMLGLGAIGLFGLPLSVFSLMGVVLVLGLGADYSLFLRESVVRNGRREPAVTLAISLSAVTTLASFGLLVLSEIPAVTGFGLVVAFGILGVYLAAPLCNGPLEMRGSGT